MDESTESQHSEASPQHTPGPWRWVAVPWGEGRTWLIGPNGSLEPMVRPIIDADPSGGEYWTAIDVTGPDATLIEAAPDLLAALAEVDEVLGSEDSCIQHNDWPCILCLVGPDPGAIRAAQDIVRLAIARATEGRDAE